ncbi:MAG TPA: ribonuclease III [Gammaproteobacteria bacterium]|nr:ribonuclease III [Gammaproteobacteria bacterium]
MRKSLSTLCLELDYRFANIKLLEAALTHRSAGSANNERLEFLGDAILSFTIAAELYRRFPKASEGELSRLRASLVKGETLAQIARVLNVGNYLHLGSGELKSGGHSRDSTLTDALEAIMGAVYLDGGLEPCQRFILSLYQERLESLSPAAHLKDPKTRLQEYLQSRKLPPPLYNVLVVSGDAHAQMFKVQCEVDGMCSIEGEGSSRRRAEQDAAAKALQLIEHG